MNEAETRAEVLKKTGEHGESSGCHFCSSKLPKLLVNSTALHKI